jgi:hypothetical protein
MKKEYFTTITSIMVFSGIGILLWITSIPTEFTREQEPAYIEGAVPPQIEYFDSY